MAVENDNLVLIGGESAGGKTASLRNLKNPEGVMYLNCESNKKCPFPSKFQSFSITDPYQVYEGFEYADAHPENFHTIVIDTLTMLMDMQESLHVLTSKDTMSAWSKYQQYLKKLMQVYVAKSKCNVIFLAHVQSIMNESAMVMEKKVPIKGALKQNGVEAFFSTVVSARRIALTDLEPYKNDLLTITEDELEDGYKYVYQTRLTKETINERIRASIGMWSKKETFIDNDCQLLINRLHKYYGSAPIAT